MRIRPLTIILGLALVATLGAATPALAHHVGPFEDATDTTAERAVIALAEEHLIDGCDEGEFCPADTVTRGQLASILTGVLTNGDDDGELDVATEPDHLASEGDGPARFDDIEGTTHEESITYLADQGMVRGCDDGDFCPEEAVSRGQMATLLDAVFAFDETDGEFFDDAAGVHGAAIDRLAAAGIAAGCGDPLTHFCTTDDVTRGQAALFVARALTFVSAVELAPLEERRERQAEIDAQREAERQAAEEAARQQAEEEEAARRAAEEEAQRQAELESDPRLQDFRNLAQCESNMDQRAYNPAGPYYGYFQFDSRTWQSVGMSGDPRDYSWDDQLAAAMRLHDSRGWQPWPACSSYLGLR